ncbi:MAG TPA: thiamine-phosphate kinase [Chthoniobacterales bacterium]|nr:thiamine-phosphate kinase [Chthoniobacterales bacterium]
MLNETSLLALITAELPPPDDSIIVGSGDDCAIVHAPSHGRSLVLKTDATIEGIHFTSATDLLHVGWKALCRPLSDFAAMGAFPQHALVTVAAPFSWKKNEWLRLSQGIGNAARAFQVIVVGGEIAKSPNHLFLSITVTGTAGSRSLLRSQAKPEDLICVTGLLGGSLESERHLHFTPRLAEGQWLATQSSVHAMMDLSDGLGSDLPRFAKASHCSFKIDPAKLPCNPNCTPEQAISDGEDYELLLAVNPQEWPQLKHDWEQHFPKLSLTPIGSMLPHNSPSTELPRGYDHLLG